MKEVRQINGLGDTEHLMKSSDYRERFVAEYLQTKIRYEKLKAFCNKIEAARLTVKPGPEYNSPFHLLKDQQRAMGEYLHILEVRAVIEDINLEEYRCN